MSRRRGVWLFIGIGLALCLVLAGVASYYASSSPDGLEKVAGDVGFDDQAQESAVSGSPLSDYGVSGVADERASVGLAGIVGVLATAAIAFGLFTFLARRRRAEEPSAITSDTSTSS